MTAVYLCYISLWTVFIGVAQTCPEPCICVDKYAHQFADCAYKDLQVVPVGLPSNVTTLSLSANKIKTLLNNSFVNITQVTSLWLAHNEIVTIEKGTLAVLVQLRNLDLSHNQVVHFPWGDLYNLTSLQLLKINNNNMVDLPRDAFSNLKDLRSLRINNNMFTTIVKGSFDSLSSISHLQIYNNPFDCTCTLQWLKDWVANALISVPEPDLITCETPEDLKGIRIVQLPNLECVAPTVHIMSQPNLENTQINEGFMLIMYCNVTGSPNPEVKWKIRTGNQEIEFNMPVTETKKNDLPLENSKQAANRFLLFKNGTLVIPRTSKREDGRYTCSATNVQGSAESSVNVAVSHEPPAATSFTSIRARLTSMKAHNPDQMEKHMTTDFDPRASFVESEKNYNPSDLEEDEVEREEGEGEGGAEGSIINESIPGSQSKANQEEFEVGSEYSDRSPLGAEAVNISQEINGNYRQTAR